MKDMFGQEIKMYAIYRVGQKRESLCFMAYNFRNTEYIFTKFGTNQSPFIHSIVP